MSIESGKLFTFISTQYIRSSRADDGFVLYHFNDFIFKDWCNSGMNWETYAHDCFFSNDKHIFKGQLFCSCRIHTVAL